MFSEEMPKILSRLFDTVEAIERAFHTAYIVEKQSSQGELALYFKNQQGQNILYFCLRYDLWTHSQTPLWFGVCGQWPEEVVNKFSTLNKGGCIEFCNYRLCPVDPKITSGENASAAIIKILEAQLQALV
ncbi:MAG: hypothetical protein WCQ99_00310 [Pseudomonadota bacterium]